MFCIVSADAKKVLGYGNNYTEELPQQLQAILDTYAASPQPVSELRSSTTREDIPPFMDVVFGTRSPYNKYIPERITGDILLQIMELKSNSKIICRC